MTNASRPNQQEAVAAMAEGNQWVGGPLVDERRPADLATAHNKAYPDMVPKLWDDATREAELPEDEGEDDITARTQRLGLL